MKVLVIGSGGREHALVHTFWRQGHTVFSHPGNPGIHALGAPLGDGAPDDFEWIARRVREEKIDLTVVGPESPLEKGIADFFAAQNLPLFGPTKKGAQMESSKSWSKAFMAKHQVPTARYETCKSLSEALQVASSFFLSGKKAVVKPSGLTGGKGVVCCQTYEEARAALQEIFEEKRYGRAGEEVVIEEHLFGPEVSLQVISDGSTMIPLLAAQDHKRLYDGDLGPNTGGMGVYAPVALDQAMQEKIEQTVIAPTLRGLKQEGITYIGILYFGLMLTEEGPKVLEYNCRFGDPETQAVLPLLESDLASLMMAAIRGELSSQQIRWKSGASCCVVLASEGYPASPITGHPIGALPQKGDLICFHASTALDSEGHLVTAGGRVLGMTALGADLEEAIEKVYEAIEEKFPWAVFRRDIGKKALSTPV